MREMKKFLIGSLWKRLSVSFIVISMEERGFWVISYYNFCYMLVIMFNFLKILCKLNIAFFWVEFRLLVVSM